MGGTDEYRPVGKKFIIRGLRRGVSEASKNGGPGACPRKIFHDHVL